jgi:hypothetical protein
MTTTIMLDDLSIRVDGKEVNVEEIIKERDNAYLERNKLVRLLAAMSPSGIRKTEIEGWDPEWYNCVYIDTSVGQLSWHYHDREAALFEDLPPYTEPWDGHTTEEKYERVKRLTENFDDIPIPN